MHVLNKWLLEIIAGKVLFMATMYIRKAIWMPDIGEILKCQQERGNSEDIYAVGTIRKRSCTLLYLVNTI